MRSVFKLVFDTLQNKNKIINFMFHVSAAHCFWPKGSFQQAYSAANAYVFAGKYDLRYFESASQKRELNEIIIHPDWSPHTTIYDADIAVATMKYPIFYTNAVQPICLPNYNSVLIHPMGTVVGEEEEKF
jgi:hypothetical protein